MADARLVYVADVYCPWCFAFAPNIMRLAHEFPEFPVEALGGNLMSQPLTLMEDLERSPDLGDFWRQVEKVSGRSLGGALHALEARKDITLFSPGADEILATLKAFVPGKSLEQIIYLEDLFYKHGKNLFVKDTIDEIALRWRIEPLNFEKALNQPAAIEATEKNLAEARLLMGEIDSYPSVFLIRGNMVKAVSRGFVHYETVLARFQNAIRDLDLEDEVNEYCSLHGTCTLGRRI